MVIVHNSFDFPGSCASIPAGYDLIAGKFYKYQDNKKTWNKAGLSCAADRAWLAMPKTSVTYNFAFIEKVEAGISNKQVLKIK